MKLGLVALRNERKLVARLPEGEIVDVAAAAALDGMETDSLASPRTLLAAGPGAIAAVSGLLGRIAERRAAGDDLDGVLCMQEDLTFLPPVPDPEKFLCVGKNYKSHLDELVRTQLIKEIPAEPTGFIKLNSVLVGDGAEVARPDGILKFDYEPELAFIIGRPGYRIPKSEAMDYVAGITLFNDLTAREIQKREVDSGTRFWTAKNMPGFGPIGPYLVTLDEVSDVNDIWITCQVNGEERSRFNTSGQIFKIPDIVEHFSRYLPLVPGDVFATGSSSGVAVGQPNADELYLRPGDNVEIAIDGMMSLRTRIV